MTSYLVASRAKRQTVIVFEKRSMIQYSLTPISRYSARLAT